MRSNPIRPSRSNDSASVDNAELPHDRDEAAERVHRDGLHKTNREPIEQARRDVESGIVDTERIGTPSDVPTSATRKGPVR
ncbi:MAG: hypothetical protein ACR2GP_16815 [Burkholderiaceae bacterium]